MEKKILTLAFALLLGIILLSACLGESTECPLEVSQTAGVIIDRFQPSYDLVPVNGTVTLQMDLKNKGTALAEDVTARMWSYGGFYTNETEAIQGPFTLNPADLSVCSAGDTIPVQWTLRAGCDPRGVTLSAYVDYTYTSESHATILLASQEEAEKIRGEFTGDFTSGQNVPSAGPIQVEVTALQNEPIIISPTTKILDIRIKFRNVGMGLAGDQGNGQIDQVELLVEGPCKFLSQNDKTKKSKTLLWNWDWDSDDDPPLLRSGSQEAFKITSLEYDGDPDLLVRDYCTIRATAKYNYRVIKATEGEVGITGTQCQVCMCRHNDISKCTNVC